MLERILGKPGETLRPDSQGALLGVSGRGLRLPEGTGLGAERLPAVFSLLSARPAGFPLEASPCERGFGRSQLAWEKLGHLRARAPVLRACCCKRLAACCRRLMRRLSW